MIVVILLVFGLCLGSFLNAMVWRIHHKMDFVHGRSQCDNCKHQLAVGDLVPVFSWLVLGGKCRYCRQPISWAHPAVELATGLAFVASYLFWPVTLAGAGQWSLFITWLGTAVGLMALAVYDFRWMLLPSRILYPTAAVAAAGRLVYIIGYEPDRWRSVGAWAAAIAVASGVFFLLFIFSDGRWIGFGDVRLGLISGSVLADPAKAFLMIFLASLLGTFFALPAVAAGRSKMTSRIPYGPFLIAATAITLLFGGSFIAWYQRHLL